MQALLSPSLGVALVLGIAVTGFVAAGLMTNGMSASRRQGVGIGAGAVGLLVTIYLAQRPQVTDAILERIQDSAISVVLAALGAAIFFWKIKSIFTK